MWVGVVLGSTGRGEAEVRYWSVILLLSAGAGSAASGPRSAEIAAQWASDGRFRFFACEFKRMGRWLRVFPCIAPPRTGENAKDTAVPRLTGSFED